MQIEHQDFQSHVGKRVFIVIRKNKSVEDFSGVLAHKDGRYLIKRLSDYYEIQEDWLFFDNFEEAVRAVLEYSLKLLIAKKEMAQYNIEVQKKNIAYCEAQIEKIEKAIKVTEKKEF